ncbi:hypothetical protein ACE6H2_023319 [Prunus campanulata]
MSGNCTTEGEKAMKKRRRRMRTGTKSRANGGGGSGGSTSGSTRRVTANTTINIPETSLKNWTMQQRNPKKFSL